MSTGDLNGSGNPTIDWDSIYDGVEILLVTSCRKNQDTFLADGRLGSYEDLLNFIFLLFCNFTPVPSNPQNSTLARPRQLLNMYRSCDVVVGKPL